MGIAELAAALSQICRRTAVPARLRCLVIRGPPGVRLGKATGAPIGRFVQSGV